MACAWCSGLGIFKTLLALGLLHRYVPNGGLPGIMGTLGQSPIFWAIVAFAVAEIIADLLPNFDVRWDRLTGLLRLAGAAGLAYLAAVQEPMALRITWAVLGIGLALFTHGIRSGARLAAQEAGTNVFVSPVTSVTETCMIFATLLPLSAMPALSALMMGFTALAGCLVMYLIFPCVRQAYRSTLFLPAC
jgi:hypothetical protein